MTFYRINLLNDFVEQNVIILSDLSLLNHETFSLIIWIN